MTYSEVDKAEIIRKLAAEKLNPTCFRCGEPIGLSDHTTANDPITNLRYLHDECAEAIADEKWAAMEAEAELEELDFDYLRRM